MFDSLELIFKSPLNSKQIIYLLSLIKSDISTKMFIIIVEISFVKLTLKDFASEVRANLDIDMFIKEATLLLDLDGSTLEDIISSMLEAVFNNRPIVDTATSTTTTTTANMTPSSPSSPDDTDSVQWSRTSATTTSGFGPKVNFSITGNSDKTNLSKLDIENMKLEAKNSLMMQISYEGYTYQRLAKTIKGVSLRDGDCLSTDQSWICAMCSLRSIHKRYLALARLNNPVNFGRSSEGTYLIVLIITPTKEKGTKSEIEVGRTFGTILSDPIFRQELLFATDEKEVKLLLWDRAQQLAAQQSTDRRRSSQYLDIRNQTIDLSSQSKIGKGIYLDLKRKIPYYWSDITEGICGKNTMRKTISTIIFLYFACLLPSIAFGLLNSKNTDKKMDVTRVIMGQTIGGLCYGVFGGQPLLVLLSTAPLALYIKIIYTISETYSINFYAMYACIGLFNSLFLIIYSVCGFSRWMKWSTSWPAVLGSIGIAIPLSLLFYMEQNIASAILNSPSNKLRKGPSNHWDLFVIALINIILSIFCLPWVHAALPHTPLHVKALADMEEHVDGGHHIKQTVIRVRETRLTLFISHVLIGLSLAMIPYPLIYIPPPVLNGLFIYMAITALQGNQMFERILLFITEQSAYPPSHYIRRVPQRKLHLFTFFQLIQLGFLCAFGFAPSPYVKLIFPVILVVQIVLRHTLIPKAIDSKYLEALDRHF
ncbi:unnamed protein product [Schistosoma margrebowiei]|uniref:Bicarbonate transporter-like transmembrane domain-containing protein n=1 Tax=Schistosoma margrebowiei TaxID=48269 RepID=A0AA84Z4Q1_9TREM|nr:unnamed protein product [Schistosoma margrebowiei]